MKFAIALTVALLPAPSHAQLREKPYKDHVVIGKNGETRIERESYWFHADGSQVLLRQTFVKDRNGALVYKYDNQSDAMKRYHEEHCRRIGPDVVPHKGEGILGGENAVGGLACSGPSESSGVGVFVDGKAVK